MLPETIPSFLILLGILIFVHEFGHFIVAKKLGIKVLRFSLGFGPILWKRQKGETEYALSAIPLGGYVKLYGEDPAEAEKGAVAEPERSFAARPVRHRIAVVSAGPLMNLFLGFLLFTGVSLFGEQVREPVVGKVSEGLPAEAAGIRPGDRIVSVDGKEVKSWEEMSYAIRISGGAELKLGVSREGKVFEVVVKPVSHTDGAGESSRPVVGVVWNGDVVTRDIPLSQAPAEGVRRTWEVTRSTFEVVGRLVVGRGNKDEVGGPIAIADMAGKALRAGVLEFFVLMAVLSVNLSVLNLLPVPVLDGGHLFFFAIEAVRGRPVSQRLRETAQQVGMILLLMLILYILYNDIMRIRVG